MKRLVVLILLSVLSLPAWAGEAEPTLDPKYEDRFKALTSELRCLKCQNQTIYESKAGLADDLKHQIMDQMHEGRTDEQIVDYLVARYGDFVLYKPKMNNANLLLWVGPFLLLAVGMVMLVAQLRKRQRLLSDAPLSEADHRRAQSLINSDSGDSRP